MSRRFTAAAVVLAAIVTALFMFRPPPEASLGTSTNIPPMVRQMPGAAAPQVVVLPIAAEAARLNAPEATCRDDMPQV